MVDSAQLRDLQAQVENSPPAEAVAASRRLIELLKPLAQKSPAKYSAQLAIAWHEHGANLALAEGSSSAIDPLTTAVGLFRDIANDTDALSLLRLTQALHSLAGEYLALDQVDAAHELLREAQQTCQRLAQLEAAASRLLDAKTSQLLATAYHHQGDYRHAIQYGLAAEAGFRGVIRAEPMAVPDFAATLKNLALSLAHEPADNAQKKDAQRKIDEALMLYRSLAKRAPQLFLGEFANTAFHSAAILLARGKKLQAMGAYENATDLYAKAVQVDPGLAESYRTAAATTVEIYLRMGNERRARKLRERYSV